MRENTGRWRLREALKQRTPEPALQAYRRWVSPKINRRHSHVRFSTWARAGRKLCEEFGTARVSFESDGIWVTDAQGLEWHYEPDAWLSALGKEMGWELEPAEVRAVVGALKPGGSYVDIGAHVGGFAIPVAKAHADVQIHAFEPVPGTRRWLAANLARNGVTDRVTIWPNAVGAAPGSARMTTFDGGSNHLEGGGKVGARSVQVEIVRLDDVLLERVPRIDAIKCDIEGAELPALHGAEKILRRDRPALMVEIDRRYTPRFGYLPEDLFGHLAKLGYSWRWFHGEELADGMDIEEALSRTNNFLFTPE